MRISLIQDSIFWADKAANLQKVGQQLAELAGKTDLVVLPEMFTTGFCVDNLQLAEGMDGDTVNTLQRWAMEFQLAITASFICSEKAAVYNRAFFVFPTGKICTADKRHLFSMGGEHLHFNAGNKRLLVDYCGFRICVLVCYDIRFPVWSRNLKNEYDLLIYVANFPERRISDWDTLLKARAIENQTYLCGVNRVGVDGMGINYNGHSTLLDFRSQPLLTFPENNVSVQTFELNLEALQVYRSKFSVWNDADDFELKIDELI